MITVKKKNALFVLSTNSIYSVRSRYSRALKKGFILAVQKNPNAITRAEQKKMTRQKILDATFTVLAREGFSGVTLAKVAETAGLSRGISNFHFQSKAQLLLETLREIQKEFDASWTTAVTNAGPSPVDRLKALIRAVLEPPIASPDRLAVWFAYWGETPSRAAYREICAAPDREWQAAIETMLSQIATENFNSHGMSLQAIACSLTAMMTGCWLEYLLSPVSFEPRDAVQACFAFLASFFPEFNASGGPA